MVTHNELRARLAQASIDDLRAVHALHLEIQKFATEAGITSPDYSDRLELFRRAERKLGQAIRASQARGEIRSAGQSRINADSSRNYLHQAISVYAYAFAEADDETFEQALKAAREAGVPGRKTVLEQLRPPPSTQPPTPRGRRTLEHMVVAINAIALGVADVDPGEVPPDLMESVEQTLTDIGTVRNWLKKVKKYA
jgi:hypothetical protein